MAKQRNEPQQDKHEEAGLANDDALDSELLEAVLHETVANSDRASLELILDVARKSEYADTTDIRAVEEVVRAIVARRFGTLKFSRRMIQRISQTLVEDIEATVKLERLWQEARASG